MELNAIAYTFSKIIQPELKQFLQRSWTLCLPLRGERGKTEKKKHFSAVRDFSLFWWHPETQTRLRNAKQKRPNRRQSKTFLGKHSQNKTSSLAVPATHPGRRRSGPQHLHSAYEVWNPTNVWLGYAKRSLAHSFGYHSAQLWQNTRIAIFHRWFVRRNCKNFLKFYTQIKVLYTVY